MQGRIELGQKVSNCWCFSTVRDKKLSSSLKIENILIRVETFQESSCTMKLVASGVIFQKQIVCRSYKVLTMVYNTQNYWVFGLCPSSGF
jgi:hypothetical protein